MIELEALQEINAEIRALGARLLTVTPELERYTRNVHRKLNLTFDILTDLHLKIAGQFGLLFVLPDYLRDLYKSHSMTLDRFNDESEYRLPMPARFVIDQGRITRGADVNADYTIRPEPVEAVGILRGLTT
jgi:peroxiredoxin